MSGPLRWSRIISGIAVIVLLAVPCVLGAADAWPAPEDLASIGLAVQ